MTKPASQPTLTRPGAVVWLTGLSGAGKTTIATALAAALAGLPSPPRVELLDGDAVRTHLSRGLGFSRADRDENVARIAFVAHLLARNDVVVLVAAISPYRAARAAARALVGEHFLEVHVATPLEACIARDTKGLYRRALDGEIPMFTGIGDPYEPPTTAELTIDTTKVDLAAAVDAILACLLARGHIATTARSS